MILLSLSAGTFAVRGGDSYVTYYSGEGASLSLGGGVTTVREILSRTLGNLTEEFSNPPYTYADVWASYNGWSFSGWCPSWWGTVWFGVTSDGYLHWHNWFHTIGGSVYDDRLWRDVNPGQYFELYFSLSSWRSTSSGVAGSPPLNIWVSLYDSSGTKVASVYIVYNMYFSSPTVSVYNSNTTASLGNLNFKLWQNSTGAYFSSDNGTTSVYVGQIYTEPTRVEIRFYIWEYNPTQPYSDYEFYVNMDKLVIRPLSSNDIALSGLPAGSWYLLGTSGNVLMNTNTTVHGSALSYTNRPLEGDEFSDGAVQGWTGVNLASLSESGGYLNTVPIDNTWWPTYNSLGAGAYHALYASAQDFWVETELTYTWQSGALSQMYLAVRDASGQVLAYIGVNDAWAWDGCTPAFAYGVWTGSSWTSWGTSENAVPASGTVTLRISRSGSTYTLTASGAYTGTWTVTGTASPVAGVYLMHTKYFSYPCDLAKWNYVRTNIPGAPQPVSGTLAGLVDYMYVKRGTFYANTTVTYSQDYNSFAVSQSPPQTFNAFDDCSSATGWSGIYYPYSPNYYWFGSSGGCICALYQGQYPGSSSCSLYAEKNLNILTKGPAIQISFSTMAQNDVGNLYDAKLTGVYLKLANGTYIAPNNFAEVSLTDRSWHSLNYTVYLSDAQNIIGLKFTWYGYGSFYFKINFYLDNVSVVYSGDLGLTIKGVPANDVVKVYQGTTLKKTVVSSGSDIVISTADVPQPFDGSIVVVSRPHMRPLASYSGTINWNDAFTYSGGALTKSSTGAQPQQAAAGSECSTTAGWTFTYNLVTGGSTPTFSSSSGYVRFDESSLSYDSGPSGDDAPRMEAYYYLDYSLNIAGQNFTISISADGGNMQYKWYSSALGDWVYTGYGEIKVYYLQGGTWTLIAQSAQSSSPALTTSVANILSSSVATVDKVRVEFHTVGVGRAHIALYMVGPQWGRVDYLRVNYTKIPDGYPGVPVTGLQPGQFAVFSGKTYWANSSGAAVIPLSAATWPFTGTVAVYPPSESYTGTFVPGNIYSTKTTKVYSQSTDTLFYELDTASYTYRAELKLLSVSPATAGGSQNVTFTFKVYENGNLLPASASVPRVLVNGVKVDAEGAGAYTWRVRVPPGAFIEAYAPAGIRVSGRLR